MLVLIDTWWNVNILTPQSFGEEQLVLIDTWWNVNTNKLGAGVDAVEVLIDTWWNVNIYNYDSNIKRTSFNRYMVECE